MVFFLFLFCYPFYWGVKINRYVKVDVWMASLDLRRFQTDRMRN